MDCTSPKQPIYSLAEIDDEDVEPIGRSGRINDLTTLSDRDLRDLGSVRREIGFNHQQVISVGAFL